MRPTRTAPHLVHLPSGGVLFARGLRGSRPPEPPPEFGLYLLGHPLDRPSLYARAVVHLEPWAPPWPYERIDWPDFAGPRDPRTAVGQVRAALAQVDRGVRTEVACGGGRGRTGTVLAAFAILQGLSAEHALTWLRTAYPSGRIESRASHRFLALLD